MLIGFLALLISISSFSSEILFRPIQDWELKKNFFGSQYALINEVAGEAKFVVMFKRLPKTLVYSELEDELKRIVASKETSKNNPWSQVSLQKFTDLNWAESIKGKMVEVEYVQDKLPHTAMVGIYPDGKEYYFIYFATETLEYSKIRKQLLPYLQHLKLSM